MAAGGSFVVGSIVAKLVLDKSGWNQSVSGVMSDAKKMSGMSASTSRAFTQVGSTLAVMGGAIVGFFGAMAKAASKSELVLAQLDATLKSTGGAAGIMRDEAINLATSLSQLTTYDDEAVLSAENLLLTFTSIGKDVFPEATKIVLDMSTALGQDLKASAIQVGKALQDPILGMTALRRVGVNFTKDQIEMVKALVNTGHSLDAQKFILRELSTEFGGSAAAAAKTFSGQMTQLKNELGNVQEEIGMAVIPILRSLVDQIKPIVIAFKEWIQAHPELVKQIGTLLLKVGGIMLVLGPIMIAIPRLVQLFGLLKLAVAALSGPFGLVVIGLAAVGAAINKLINDHKKALDEEIAKETEYGNKLGILNRTRGEAIEKGIIKQKDWQDLVNRFGRDYMKVYQAIATMPEYAKLKTVMDGQIEASKGVKGGIEGVGTAAGGAKDPIFDLAESISAAQKAEKEWTEYLKSTGILMIKEKSSKIAELLGYEDKLGQMLRDGLIDSTEYGKGIKDLNEKLKELGSTTVTQVLPPARDLNDIIKKAAPIMDDAAYTTGTMEQQIKALGDSFGVTYEQALLCLYQLKAFGLLDIKLPDMPFSSAWVDPAKIAANEVSTRWSQLYDDIKTDFGDTFATLASEIGNNLDFLNGEFFDHAINIKAIFQDLWGSVKDAFFRMIGDMVGDWVLGQFKNLFDSIGKTATKTMADAATTAVGAATDITKGASAAISGLWTGLGAAVGSFLGTVLAGIIAGGPSGHQQQQMINDMKDARNFLAEIRNWFFSAGSGFGGASYEFITGHIGDWLGWIKDAVADKGGAIKTTIDLTRIEICKRLDTLNKQISNLGGAAAGAYVPEPALMAVAERGPEIIVPVSKLPALARAGGGGTVNITLRIDGQVITDRDYVRRRILPELIEALESSVHKVRLQQRLGVSS